MTAKKNHKKRCRHHPQRHAQGTCSACGKHICTSCSLIVRGIWYCLDTKCRPVELLHAAADIQPAEIIPKELRQIRSQHTPLALHLFITIILCSIVLVTVILRDRYQLMEENSALRESRMTLIGLLKNGNHQDTIKQAPEPATALSSDKQPVAAPRHRSAIITKTVKYQPPPDIPHNLANGSVSQRTVSLTFDGGSSANAAMDILDTLASRSVTATMFLTGEFIRKFPDITRKIVTNGHECGNHTMGHPHLTTYDKNRMQSTLPGVCSAMISSQLADADALFFSVTGSHFYPMWRVPYGEFNSSICLWGYEAGYLHVGWRQGRTWFEGLDSNDWIADTASPGYKSPEEFLEKIIRMSTMEPPGINGGIILMHLGTERKDAATQTYRVLGKVIDTLRSNGYAIIPASQMAASAGIDLALLPGRCDIQ